MMWRERRVLLIVLGVLLAANLGFFFTYRVQYVNRLADLDARKEQAERELVNARASRVRAEQQLKSYAEIQKEIDTFYTDRWSTQHERLTPLIIEVKRLAEASDLVPAGYSFSRTESKTQPAVASATPRANAKEPPGATVVTITFAVQGAYEQVRRLINLLELSEQFVIIDQVSLTSTAGNTLNMNIQLKTIFHDPKTPAAPGRRS